MGELQVSSRKVSSFAAILQKCLRNFEKLSLKNAKKSIVPEILGVQKIPDITPNLSRKGVISVFF